MAGDDDADVVADDEAAMRLAIEQARLAVPLGDLPYGAVVVAGDRSVLSRAWDRMVPDGDLTAHAEILAVRAATGRHGHLAGATLVSTVEPCAMCFAAAWTAGASRLVFGLSMIELAEVRPDAMDEVVITSQQLDSLARRRLTIVAGVSAEACWRLHV